MAARAVLAGDRSLSRQVRAMIALRWSGYSNGLKALVVQMFLPAFLQVVVLSILDLSGMSILMVTILVMVV